MYLRCWTTTDFPEFVWRVGLICLFLRVFNFNLYRVLWSFLRRMMTALG